KGNAGNLMAQMYFQQLFELRRRNPGDDLTTQLVQAEEDGNKLTNEELTANIILLFGAGHETTVNLIGNGLLALHRNPDQLTRLNVRPLSFGGGIHFCLGAQLARIEAEIAIATLLRRLPDLRIDNVENPQWRPTFVLRGLKQLPASW